MSIYATQWVLRFPRYGQWYPGCELRDVIAQGVPPHIGSPGHHDDDLDEEDPYETDTYEDFLPPAVETDSRGFAPHLRAVVFVAGGRETKDGQRYIDPLLVLSGVEYAGMTFVELHGRICDALRGERTRWLSFTIRGKEVRLVYEDGTIETVPMRET